MNSVKQDARYYSVGGPVQPDRACYVTRKSDEILFSRLAQGEYCQVLAPPDTGKTSLMAHAADRLREAGVAVATVDLAQISNRDLSEDVARWYYSFAYRVMRELRIRSNIQTWWQERSGLTNLQRLREFFLEVVLADTDQPVVIFVDRIDAVLDRQVSLDLFGAIRACHDARATEPNYRRLTFALLGSESVGHRIPQDGISPFGVCTAVSLTDFRPDELEKLTVGLGTDAMTSRAIAARVWYWTSGHPYLSQKIFRALSRREGPRNAEAVDAVAAALFLPRNAVREEPHLSMVADQLLHENKTRTARLSLYGKLRKGATVTADPMLRPHRELLRSGVVSTDTAGRLVPRNKIYAEVFTAHWVNQSLPLSFRGLGIAAAVLATVLVIPVWYTEYLPRPYVNTLSEPGQDFVSARDAFQRLRMLPGFKPTAKELFTQYVVRESRQSNSLAEVRRLAERLPDYRGRTELRLDMLAEYWDRSVNRALRQGRRDDALLFSLKALERPTPERQRQVGELLGADLDSLVGTVRHSAVLTDLALDGSAGLLSLLDADHRVSTWQLAERGLRRVASLDLVAEEILPLQASLRFDGKSRGRRLQIAVYTNHPRPEDLLVEIRAPSGRTVQARLRSDATTDDGAYQLDSRRDPVLRPLLEESPSGTWNAFFTDTLPGTSGTLQRWTLGIDGQAAVAPPLASGPQMIPEPVVARQATSVLDPDGRRALIWPTGQGVRGDILLWNLNPGEIIARLARPADFQSARFALGSDAVLVISSRNVEVWDTARAEMRLQLPYEPSLPPLLSENGRFLVVDSIVEDSSDNVLGVWDLESGKEIGRLLTGQLASLVATDSTGRYLAVGDGDRRVRLWSVSGNRLLAEFEHGAAPTAVHFDPTGSWLATQDATHSLRLWNLEQGGDPVLVRRGAAPWSVSFGASWMVVGSLDRGFETLSLSDLARRGPVLQHGLPGLVREGLPGGAGLMPERGLAVTWDGETAVKVWRLPPNPTESGVPGPGVAVSAMAMASGGQDVAVALASGEVRIFPAGQPLASTADAPPSYIGHLKPVTAMVFDRAGMQLASAALDGSIRVWDVATGAPRSFSANQADGAVLDIAFTPDGSRVISASRRSVLVIDAQSGSTLERVGIQSRRPQIAVTPDGREIWIAADRGGLTRWQWLDDVVEAMPTPSAGAVRVALDARGRLAAVVDSRRRVWVFDRSTQDYGESVRLPAAAERLWFAPDGRFLFVQAGPWLHRLATAPGELRLVQTRLLPQPPDLSLPAEQAEFVRLLFGAQASLPTTMQVGTLKPFADPVEDPPENLEARLEPLLQLQVDDRGEAAALPPR